ncbi:MAG: hypothetical protein LBO06_06225 [Bacteroidales bacterium]|jgi:hypothetical protein|nr:hypothetical protein [Bacteroidales bacterium]
MKQGIEDFWQWFVGANEQLMDIDSLKEDDSEALLMKFDEVLKAYSEGLDFEIGDLTTHGRTLLFTANGNADYFEDVFELCDNAPILDFWNILPLRQPEGANASVAYGNYHYSSKDVWFVPMESEDEAGDAGIRVGIANYEADNEEQIIAVYSLVEAILGEEDCSTLIAYFEVCSLPADLEDEGFVSLKELPDFVAWHLGKKE